MGAICYDNFDLLVLPAASGYQALVVNSPAGQAAAAFAWPFTADELAAFYWLAGRDRDAAPPPASLSPRDFGARLFAAAFAGRVGELLQRSLDAAGRAGQGLRIRLRLDKVPDLGDLPWEYLHLPGLAPFPALSESTPVVRYMELAQRQQSLRTPPPLRVLAVAASPRSLPPLDIRKEWDNLGRALAPLRGRGLLALERLEPPTVPALLDRLSRPAEPVHVLHFIGHGVFDPGAQQGALAFVDEAGGAQVLGADGLRALLADHKPLRLVFLNACEGARASRENAFGGVAQALVLGGIPAVVAMQFPVSDDAGSALAGEFYQGLAAGSPVDAALARARKAVYLTGSELEWGAPVLFSRSDDSRLIELPEGDRRPVVDTKPFEPETILIPGGPFLMGSDDPAAPAWERPQHAVALPDFRIGKHPVTVRQYAAFIKDRKEQPAPPGWFNREPPAGRLDHPVTDVSWLDALAYCAWLSEQTGRRYALPGEAEWEVAAAWDGEILRLRSAAKLRPAPLRMTRGAGEGEMGGSGQKRRYPWGDEWIDGRCNAAGEGTTAVTAHPDGASAYGVEDLLGNVQEWTRSLWGGQPAQPDFAYPYDPADGREVAEAARLPAQARLVHRGGSYKSQPADLRVTARGNALPDSKIAWRGFRVVMHLEKSA